MKPILLVKNDPAETCGVAPKLFADEGVDVITVDALDPAANWHALDQVSGVVMFGGSMNVDETDEYPFLLRGREITREAVNRAVPYLGVCLGAQILARALERPVFRAPVPEVGFEPVRMLPAAATDPLLSHLTDGDQVFHWHQDTFDLPEGAEQLATGDLVAIQAYRVRDTAWGIQFHFEVDGPEIDLWLNDYGDGLKERWGKSPEEVRSEAAAFLPAHEERGRELFRRFAGVVRATG